VNEMPKFCPECGVMGTATGEFCSACGARIGQAEESSTPEEKREERIYYVIGLIGFGCLVAFSVLFILRTMYYGIFGFFAALFLFAWVLHHIIKIRKTWKK
jgi:hypothetical protein